MTGSALSLVTWAACLAVLACAGLAPAALALGRSAWPVVARHALWWGSAIATATVLAASLLWPLRGPQAAAWVAAWLGGAAAAGLAIARGRVTPTRARLPWWPTLVAAGAAALALAIAAMGRVTNYDTGLYHLGAISYAGNVGTVPGLANLYFGLGYSNAEFPLAAFLGNGPWGDQGYRLLNALIVLAFVADVLLRLAMPRRGPGTLIACLGLGVVLVPMIGLADYWVVSPSSDAPVFVLSIVSIAYLADGVTGRRPGADAAVAFTSSVLACALRPTMLPFALLVGVIAIIAVRRRGRKAMLAAGALTLIIAIEQAMRDRLLSGWLQYPLSVLAFDVPWRAADPVDARAATLGTARDPSDLWQAAEGWSWVGAWARRLPMQWETWLVGCLVVAIVIGSAMVRGRVRHPRRLALVALPPCAMSVAWFLVTPPAFRFAWGPVFGSLMVVLAWILWSIPRRSVAGRAVLAVASALVIAASVAATLTRSELDQRTASDAWTLGPLQLEYAFAPVRSVTTVPFATEQGATVLIPEGTDQCWATYPLCTPDPDPSLRLLGPALADGIARG